MRHRISWLTPLAIVTTLLVAAPVIFLVVELAAADRDNIVRAFTRPATITQVTNTLLLVVSVTVCATIVGVLSAFALARLDLPGKRLWWVLSVLPLAVPSYVAGLAWFDFTSLRGFFGSWFILVLATAPYVTLPTAAAFRRADRSVEDVARTLGAGPIRSFTSMTLPQVAPAAAAGALLIALYTVAEYGVVAIMRFPTMTTAVQSAFGGSFNRQLAIVLSVMLAAMALVVVVGERLLRRPVLVTRVGSDTNALRRPSRPVQILVCGGLFLVFTLAVLLPVSALLVRLSRSIADNSVEWERLLQAALVTTGLGVAGAVVATLAALPVGILAARRPGRVSSALETITYLGHGLPGIVIGLAMVYMSLQFVPGIYQTLALLVIAYGIMFVPKAMGSVRSAVGQVPESLEDAARSLGRKPIQVWWEVTSRIAWPGIAAGALLVAVTVMKELPATLMMRPIGTDTLATRLWQLTDIHAYGSAASYAIALILVASIPAIGLAAGGAGVASNTAGAER